MPTYEVRWVYVCSEWGELHHVCEPFDTMARGVARAWTINEAIDATAKRPAKMPVAQWIELIKPYEAFLRDLIRVGGDIDGRATVFEVSHAEREIPLGSI